MTDQRFRPREHIRRDADFQRVYRRRCSAADERLVVYAAANDLAFSRLGLSVSRKVGSAVARNRWKRVLREAFRLARAEFAPGTDFVVVVRSAERPTLDAARKSLVLLTRKAAGKLARGRP